MRQSSSALKMKITVNGNRKEVRRDGWWKLTG
jgi:hypothetical protein